MGRISIDDSFVQRVIARIKHDSKSKTMVMVAEQYGTSQSALSGIIHGKHKPSAELASRILGVSVESIKAKSRTPSSLPRPKRGWVRDTSGLPPGNVPGGGARGEQVVERGSGMLRVPGPELELDAVLPEGTPSAAKTEKVTRLGKSKARELELQNKARVLAGLSKLTLRVHRCLKCKKQFETVSNRLCVGCQPEFSAVLSGVEFSF